jgi:hypothetical protein
MAHCQLPSEEKIIILTCAIGTENMELMKLKNFLYLKNIKNETKQMDTFNRTN